MRQATIQKATLEFEKWKFKRLKIQKSRYIAIF